MASVLLYRHKLLLSMRYFILALLLLAGCEDDRSRLIRYCKEHNIPYQIGDSEADPSIKYIRQCQRDGTASESQIEYLRIHTEAGR